MGRHGGNWASRPWGGPDGRVSAVGRARNGQHGDSERRRLVGDIGWTSVRKAGSKKHDVVGREGTASTYGNFFDSEPVPCGS